MKDSTLQQIPKNEASRNRFRLWQKRYITSTYILPLKIQIVRKLVGTIEEGSTVNWTTDQRSKFLHLQAVHCTMIHNRVKHCVVEFSSTPPNTPPPMTENWGSTWCKTAQNVPSHFDGTERELGSSVAREGSRNACHSQVGLVRGLVTNDVC